MWARINSYCDIQDICYAVLKMLWYKNACCVILTRDVLYWKNTVTYEQKKNTAGGMDVSFVSVVCCHAEVCASGRSLVLRSRTEYIYMCVCVCVCHHEPSITRPWPTSDCCAKEKKNKGRFRWSCGLRSRPAAAWLLGLGVRNLLRAWMSVFYVLPVLCVCVWYRNLKNEAS